MPDTLRIFVAVELPSGIQDRLGQFIEAIKNQEDKITWVSPKKIHLTLKFLGNIPIRDTDSIKEVLSKTAGISEAFDVSIKGIGLFPDERQPRVVWAGIDTGSDNLKKIFLKLEENLLSTSIPKEERVFTAHLTLGRIKYLKNTGGFVNNILRHKEDLFGNFSADGISLIRSTLTQKGSIYETIYKAQLCPR